MKLALISALILGVLIAAAAAQVWIMSPSGGGMASGSHSSGPPPSCNGTADYSQGCALLGGL